MTNKTIAIVNDPKVTLGSISNDIQLINAWNVNWENLNLNDNYIILGGHMGSYQENEFSYLKEEKDWLKIAVTNNTKILGICLGAQLIADALGGKAYLSENIEFGFKELNFNKNIDSKFFNQFKNIKVFTWHRDTFEIPYDAELIASTNFPQIFKLYNTVALQFHPEINLDLFNSWYENEVSKIELKNFDINSELSYLTKNSISLNKAVNSFIDDWLLA